MRGPSSLFALLIPVVVAGAAGCQDPEKDCIDVSQSAAEDGNVSDETWLVFKDQEKRATDSAETSPQLTTPADGQTFHSADGALTFAWSSPLKITSLFPTPPPARAGWRRHDDPLQRAIDSVSSFVIPSAHAHLPPKTGDMY